LNHRVKAPLLAKKPWVIPATFGVLAVLALLAWFIFNPENSVGLRIPGTDRGSDSEPGGTNAVLAGKVVLGDGQPADLPGAWTRFRGADNDAISKDSTKLSSKWQPGEPREFWGIDAGEGYAGAAVQNGRVYVMDYDRDKRQDALRCLSLANGREIWRYAYPVSVKRNHGMSRTVPALSGNSVVAMGPKCHVVCADATSGELRWGLNLVRQFGATVPPWYAGQCPLIDGRNVILAPGGKEALLVALDLESGKIVWQTPNPRGWKMTHSSIMPLEVNGVRMFVYSADKGVVGVAARNGALLWETGDWKISIATVPSPLILSEGRIFLSGGYNAGSLMILIKREGEHFIPETLFKLGADVFGATQHTPIAYENHIYGVRADGKFVCLSFDGKVVWTSDSGQQFGLGSFILADGKIYAMNDTGLLRMIEATPGKYNLLGQAEVLKGRESWGPMALAGGRLIVRDLTRMVCIDVAKH
jgi:outer membrane protein assembly factor BamB